MKEEHYDNFEDYYKKFYLNEHKNRWNKILHLIATTYTTLAIPYFIYKKQYKLLLSVPVKIKK
jgi:hypothetical protein